MSTPTDGELRELVDGPFGGMPGIAQLWLTPVRPLMPTLLGTKDKPVGQFTVPELLVWAAFVGYMVTSMALAETMALNLVRVAVRGR